MKEREEVRRRQRERLAAVKESQDAEQHERDTKAEMQVQRVIH